MKVNGFEDLEIWQLSRQLTKLVFELTKQKDFIKDSKFKNQIRAAAGSIMDNIAEGYARSGNKEFINFLLIAKGSTEEVRSQSYRAFDFEYISDAEFHEALRLTDSISRKIHNLIEYLKTSDKTGRRYAQ